MSPLYIRVIKDMYEGGRTSARTPGRAANDFYVDMGMHQWSASSPFLFTIVMDELTKGIQDELPLCYLHMTMFLLMRLERELMTS